MKFKEQFPNVWKDLEQYQCEEEGEVIFRVIGEHCLDKRAVIKAIDEAIAKVENDEFLKTDGSSFSLGADWVFGILEELRYHKDIDLQR
jgi:hypothetical protein